MPREATRATGPGAVRQLGYRKVMPHEWDPSAPTRPFIDLKSGYVERAIDSFPRQGVKAPWRLYQNYARDIMMLRRGSLEDEGIEFSRPAPTTAMLRMSSTFMFRLLVLVRK